LDIDLHFVVSLFFYQILFVNDIICGHEGDDHIIGGSGNDELWGNEGNDILEGNDGDDRLWGHKGINQLDGGSGKDSCFNVKSTEENCEIG